MLGQIPTPVSEGLMSSSGQNLPQPGVSVRPAKSEDGQVLKREDSYSMQGSILKE